MLLLSDHDTSTTPCYFTINVPALRNNSIESPCCSPTSTSEQSLNSDPFSPFLPFQVPVSPRSPTMDSLMQVQTNAAHGSSHYRPQPQPVQQNVLHVTSDDSSSSSSSTSSAYDSHARCSRCQRTSSLDGRTGKSNMVPYGLNLWYCVRCANIVGLLVNR